MWVSQPTPSCDRWENCGPESLHGVPNSTQLCSSEDSTLGYLPEKTYQLSSSEAKEKQKCFTFVALGGKSQWSCQKTRPPIYRHQKWPSEYETLRNPRLTPAKDRGTRKSPEAGLSGSPRPVCSCTPSGQGEPQVGPISSGLCMSTQSPLRDMPVLKLLSTIMSSIC